MLRQGFSTWALLLALGAAPAGAEPGDHIWSDGWAASGTGIAMDGAGAVSTAGTFNGSLDFGGGALNAVTGFDVFVAKLGNGGGHIWSNSYPPTFFVAVTAIGASPSGNTYVAGTLPKGGTIDFGGGAIGGNFGDCWAVGFDAQGNHMWSETYGRGLISSIDATDGFVAFAARNVDTLNFGGGDLGVSGDSQAIAVLLTDQGGHVWSAAYGDGGYQEGLEVGLSSSSNLVLLAGVRSDIDFGGGTLSPDANNDYALARFDAAGAHQWSNLYHVDGTGFTQDMDVTDFGAIAITGQFAGNADFGDGPLVSSGSDVFVARFDGSGNSTWSGRFGGNGGESGEGVAFTPSNGVIVTGRYAGAVDFGGGALPHAGSNDVFVLALDTAGDHVWSTGFGSTSFESRGGVEVGQNGEPVIDVSGSTDIDFGGGTLSGSYYIAKLATDDDPPVSTPEAAAATALRLTVAPNPFRTHATLRLAGTASLDGTDGEVDLTVFDAAGRRVKRFAGLDAHAGGVEVSWDGRSDAGLDVVPGVYFVRLQHATTSAAWRVVRIR